MEVVTSSKKNSKAKIGDILKINYKYYIVTKWEDTIVLLSLDGVSYWSTYDNLATLNICIEEDPSKFELFSQQEYAIKIVERSGE